jgi:hypothetical protein
MVLAVVEVNILAFARISICRVGAVPVGSRRLWLAGLELRSGKPGYAEGFRQDRNNRFSQRCADCLRTIAVASSWLLTCCTQLKPDIDQSPTFMRAFCVHWSTTLRQVQKQRLVIQHILLLFLDVGCCRTTPK